MSRPEAVVFDLGKVLVDFDYSIAARKIAAKGNIADAEAQDFIASSPTLLRYESGGMTSLEFCKEICAGTGFSGGFEEFAGFFADIFTPIPVMVDFHAKLRRAGFRTYVLSNTNELAVGHIQKRFPFYKNFAGYVLSFQHGAMKPDAKLYEVLEKMSGCGGEQILYIDDRLENVEAAIARGWRTIHHQSPEQTFAEARQIGLPC